MLIDMAKPVSIRLTTARVRRLLLALATFFFVCAFTHIWVQPAAAATLNYRTSRIYGPRQIDTAVAVAQAGWQQAANVILATADNFPDALVAAPLSHFLHGPVLLTHRDAVDQAVLAEMQRLGAKHVVVLGGTAALSAGVTKDLDRAGLTWERVWGATQYDTAAKVAELLPANGRAIIANGEQFYDALAISAYAGATETPVLLTAGKTMPQPVAEELQKIQRKNGGPAQTEILVIGGEAVVPSGSLPATLAHVQRIAGQERFQTAARVYQFAADQLTGNPSYLVTADNFPDALVAGALAAKNRSPLLMSETGSLPPVTFSILSAVGGAGQNVVIIGGERAVAPKVEDTVNGKLAQNYLLGGVTIVIDPGHGGPDSGAVGPAYKTREADVNLAVGLNVVSLLQEAGAKVLLTRSKDVSPAGRNYDANNIVTDLQPRVAMANQADADIFVSIHSNQFSNPQANGTETYYSSHNPRADLGAALARSLQDNVVQQGGLQSRGVKQANFWVIKYTKMPAVLVELGFLSNPGEEKLLASPDFQQQAAQGIYRGILAYYKGLY